MYSHQDSDNFNESVKFYINICSIPQIEEQPVGEKDMMMGLLEEPWYRCCQV